MSSIPLEGAPEAPKASPTLTKSVGTLLAGDVVNRALRLLATIVLARTLTLDDFGLLNVAIAVSGVAVTSTTLGLPELGARDAAIHPEKASWLAGRVLTARVTAVSIALLVAIALVVAVAPTRTGLALPAAAMALLMASSLEWLARGMERMGGLARAWALGGFTIACGSIVVAITSGNATAALWCFALAEAVTAAACWVAVAGTGRPVLGFRGLTPLLSRSWPLWLSSAVIYGYSANIDTILIAAVRSEAEAGLYSAPYRVFLVLNVVGVFAAYSLMPRLSREQMATGDNRPPAVLLTTLWALLAYGAIVVGAASALAEPALKLVFGEPFGEATTTFILLCTAVAWYTVGFPAGYSLIAIDRNRRFLLGALMAGVVNLILNVVLIPPFGIEGAGIATVAAFSCGAFVWLWARGLDRRHLLRLVVSLLVLTVVGTLCATVAELRVPVGLATLMIGATVLVGQARRARFLGLGHE